MMRAFWLVAILTDSKHCRAYRRYSSDLLLLRTAMMTLSRIDREPICGFLGINLFKMDHISM
jgi:hypothetical protein